MKTTQLLPHPEHCSEVLPAGGTCWHRHRATSHCTAAKPSAQEARLVLRSAVGTQQRSLTSRGVFLTLHSVLLKPFSVTLQWDFAFREALDCIPLQWLPFHKDLLGCSYQSHSEFLISWPFYSKSA